MYDTLYSSPMFLGGPALNRLSAIVKRMGEDYLVLREHCRANEKLAFKVTPKCHKLMHLPLYASVVNPRFMQKYAEESFIGSTTKVWARSMKGRYKDAMQSTVLLKRSLALLLRMEF